MRLDHDSLSRPETRNLKWLGYITHYCGCSGLDASAQYSYSSDTPNIPTLDTLAAQWFVFDNVWDTPACTTTRGSISHFLVTS